MPAGLACVDESVVSSPRAQRVVAAFSSAGGPGRVATGPASPVVPVPAPAPAPISLADCAHCPFATDGAPTNPVLGESLGRGHFVIVGEGPGEAEVREGRPFVGYTGHRLNELLVGAGLNRIDAIVLNATACRPKGVKDERRMATAVWACRPRLLAEHAQFTAAAACSGNKPTAHLASSSGPSPSGVPGANMVLALGTWAAAAVLGKRGNIDKQRGPLRMVGPPWGTVVATYHPARTFPKRDPWALGPLRVDLARFARFVGGAAVPAPRILTSPMAAQIADLHNRAFVEGLALALDVETIGTVGRSWEALSPKYARLRAVGLGVVDLGLSVAWPPPTEAHRAALAAVLGDTRVLKVLHNKSYDLPILARHGLVVR